jgi:hypothetical protein
MEAATLALIMEADEADLAKSLAPHPQVVQLCKSMEVVALSTCSCCGEVSASPYTYLEKDISVADFLDGLTELARRKLLDILANAGITTLEVAGEVALVGVLGEPMSGFAISEAVFREWFSHSVAVTKGMMNTISTRLVNTLSKGLAEGATRADLAREISQTWESMTLKHAAMVARTEAAAATNYGTLLGYEFGGVETKEWLHLPAASKVPRIAHAAMDGQVQPIGKPFIEPGGVLLMFPADPSAPFGSSHNCHCILMPGPIDV